MITLTDLFCGAGGSSSGAIQNAGVTVRLAANHWQLAVDTHNTNHPTADHDVADISQVEPRRYPRTDILWASPECTNHSQAKGKKRKDQQADLFGDTLPDEAAVRSRATMWDVLRFAEVHRYRAIVVENVVDVRDWIMWPAWTTGLTNLGYDFRIVYLNSMFAQANGLPAPQSRDRLYVVAWQAKNRRPDLGRWTRPEAHCAACGKTGRAIQAWKRLDRQHGRYRAQYVWRCPTERCHAEVHPGVLPAAAAIDWSLPAERIGDRVRPLAPKTVARIEAGLRRYARPIHLEAAGNTFERRPGVRAWPIDEPLKTIHTTASKALACPPMVVPAGGTWNDEAASVAEPFRTRTTRDTEALVVPSNAMVMRNNSRTGDQGGLSTPVMQPVGTITTAGHQSLIRWDHLLIPYDRTGLARTVAEPMATQTTVQGEAVIGPQVAVDDCTFRMLQPHEIQAAMAFADDYVVLGNQREKVRQLGNAVTPPAARDLIAAVVDALAGAE